MESKIEKRALKVNNVAVITVFEHEMVVTRLERIIERIALLMVAESAIFMALAFLKNGGKHDL